MNNFENHIPVLLNEVLSFLNTHENGLIVDCTFGAGGYSKEILNKTKYNLIGIDRDNNVKQFADLLKQQYKDRFNFYNIKYSEIQNIVNKVDGIILDLGVSSMQLDNKERGFSFQKDYNLDMRMGKNDFSAFDVINNKTEIELADIIYNYGDEVKAREIAKKIIEVRKDKTIKTTYELANIIQNIYGNKKGKINPATKTFQAIRIYVNDELNELKKILEISKTLLNKNGKLIIVSFHSLEDKIVKDFIKKETNKGVKNNKYPKNDEEKFCFKLLTKKPIIPTDIEVKQNIRSRSAKMRVLEKC